MPSEHKPKQEVGARIVYYREAREVLQEIERILISPTAKVVGFNFTVKNEHSITNLKFGDTNPRKYRSAAIKYKKWVVGGPNT